MHIKRIWSINKLNWFKICAHSLANNKHLNLMLTGFVINKTIGKGGYGMVYSAILESSPNEEVAAKIVNKHWHISWALIFCECILDNRRRIIQ